jgi:hypothetical protein
LYVLNYLTGLFGGEEDPVGFLIHELGQLGHSAVSHDLGLAVLDAGRLLSPLGPGSAKIAIGGGEGDIIDPETTVRQGGHNLIKMNTAFADRIAVFLFTGHFAGMAAAAVFVIYH